MKALFRLLTTQIPEPRETADDERRAWLERLREREQREREAYEQKLNQLEAQVSHVQGFVR
jgi:uncharacterized protein